MRTSDAPRVAADLDRLAVVYRSRILDGDQAGAEALVTDALLNGVTAERVCAEVLASALCDVGTMWERGELSVADEHMASEITSAVVLRLLTPNVRSGGRVAVVSCGLRSGHDLGGRMFSSLLMMRGWSVTFLGGGTPLDALEQFIDVRRPDLLAFSIKLPGHLGEVIDLVARLRRASVTPHVLIGGAAVTGATADLGADCAEDDLDAAMAWVERTFAQHAP